MGSSNLNPQIYGLLTQSMNYEPQRFIAVVFVLWECRYCFYIDLFLWNEKLSAVAINLFMKIKVYQDADKNA